MALSLDDFTSASRPKRMQCTLGQVLDALDDDDEKVVRAAIADENVTHSAIAKVLVANGHTITQGVVGRHRKGDCACD